MEYSEKEKDKIKQAEQSKTLLDKYGISYCLAKDEHYPVCWRNLSGMPAVIYYKGAIEIINAYKNVAVIGSRKASAKGRELSYKTGKMIGESGLNLVNGLALGCDTEALRGALAAEGRCIAILPCGLEQIQPKANQELANEVIKKGGCLLSEYPVGTEPQKYRYVERDRLQSAISQGVLVVEAEKESGTMHTVNFAMKQYKRIACYQDKLLEFASGNKYLEEYGKAQILKKDEDVDEFLKKVLEEKEYEQMSLGLF